MRNENLKKSQNVKSNQNAKFKAKSQTVRMIDLQIMNLVNEGCKNGMTLKMIYNTGDSIINACQLFISNEEIEYLRKRLAERISQKSIDKHNK